MSSEHSATIHTTPFEHTADNKLHFVPVDLAREKKNSSQRNERNKNEETEKYYGTIGLVSWAAAAAVADS